MNKNTYHTTVSFLIDASAAVIFNFITSTCIELGYIHLSVSSWIYTRLIAAPIGIIFGILFGLLVNLLRPAMEAHKVIKICVDTVLYTIVICILYYWMLLWCGSSRVQAWEGVYATIPAGLLLGYPYRKWLEWWRAKWKYEGVSLVGNPTSDFCRDIHW